MFPVKSGRMYRWILAYSEQASSEHVVVSRQLSLPRSLSCYERYLDDSGKPGGEQAPNFDRKFKNTGIAIGV